MADPVLSVCIVHWNTPDDLADCLDALDRFPSTAPMEVVVVDNASTPAPSPQLRSAHPAVRWIDNPTNRCYAEGCNQAADAARGTLLLLLNPDARVTAGALDRLIAATEGGTRMASARLVWPDGRPQDSVRGYPTPRAVLAEMTGFARCCRCCDTWRMRGFDYDSPGVAPQPMASCWLIPRAAWEAVGPMDPRFPLYFNDVDWAWRARAAGWSTVHAPDAVVQHEHGGTTRRVRSAAVWESRKAFLRYWRKHHAGDPFLPLAACLVTVEAWARTGRWGRRLAEETTPETLAADFAATERPGAGG
ncbi:MAG: glycosyltransferase family 2 protein [Armatimonadota bacterium]